MLDLLSLRYTQRIEDTDQSLRAEQSHQIILQRDIESGFTGVALTSGTSSQLIVDTSGFVTLRTDDLQTTGSLRLLVQFDIRIGSNGYRTMDSRIRHDLRFLLMELCIQHIVANTASGQHLAQLLTGFNGDGTH